MYTWNIYVEAKKISTAPLMVYWNCEFVMNFFLFFFWFRNIIHGSDGPETAKDEINLWFKPEELVSYTSNAEKWVYGVN